MAETQRFNDGKKGGGANPPGDCRPVLRFRTIPDYIMIGMAVERAKLRRAWRDVINSPLVKGNNLTAAQRELIERAGDAIAGTMERKNAAQDLHRMARVEDAARICGIGLDKLDLDHARLAGAAARMMGQDYEGAMLMMDSMGFTRVEQKLAAVLAAVALWPPAKGGSGGYGPSEYFHDMRNIVETFAPELWKDGGVRERMLGYAKAELKRRSRLGGI